MYFYNAFILKFSHTQNHFLLVISIHKHTDVAVWQYRIYADASIMYMLYY